ncbi:STAS domain-containing protein [Nocardiopsis rhodophaea]|uniref:STAS domain-containing protein n=1 Tax=Nocardiopsis rhodophaea TaxID=280238 RepID=UPI0031E09C0D
MAITRWESSTLVRVTGELDLSNITSLERRLAEVEQGSGTSLVIDLTALHFIDSTGLNSLARLDQRLRRTGGRVTVMTRGRIGRIFHVIGLDQVLDVRCEECD